MRWFVCSGAAGAKNFSPLLKVRPAQDAERRCALHSLPALLFLCAIFLVIEYGAGEGAVGNVGKCGEFPLVENIKLFMRYHDAAKYQH